MILLNILFNIMECVQEWPLVPSSLNDMLSMHLILKLTRDNLKLILIEACICNVFNLFIILSNGAELRQIRNIYYQLSQTCFKVTWMDLKSKATKPRMEHQKGFFLQ